MLKYFVLSVIFFSVKNIEGKYLNEKPSFLTQCSFEQTNFNSCFAQDFELILREWKNGVPGLKSIGSFDPLHVKRVKLAHDTGTGSLSLNADFQNVKLSGISKTSVKDARLDRNTWTARFKILMPKISFDADYKLKGRVLTIPLNGAGTANFETGNTVIYLQLNMKIRKENGFVFTDVTDASCNIKSVDSLHVQLNNLFNGQKELEDSTNALFNENWREFYGILKPVVEETMVAILKDRFKKLFAYVPGNYLIKDINNYT